MHKSFKSMNIGVVIVSFCGYNDTIECIKSIVESEKSNAYINLVIVDNCSPHDSVTIDKLILDLNCNTSSIKIVNGIQLFSYNSNLCINLIESNKNGGFGYANNIGIHYLKNSGCDLCILLNNDTIIENDFFSKIIIPFVNMDTLLAVSPMSVNYYSHEIDSNGFGYMCPWTGQSSHHRKFSVKYLVGSCLIVNNIQSMPLFDESFFLYYEDVDYSLTLQRLGYRLLYYPDAIFYHKVSKSTSINPSIEFIKIQSCCYFLKKNFHRRYRLVYQVVRTIYYALKFKFGYIKELYK